MGIPRPLKSKILNTNEPLLFHINWHKLPTISRQFYCTYFASIINFIREQMTLNSSSANWTTLNYHFLKDHFDKIIQIRFFHSNFLKHPGKIWHQINTVWIYKNVIKNDPQRKKNRSSEFSACRERVPAFPWFRKRGKTTNLLIHPSTLTILGGGCVLQ